MIATAEFKKGIFIELEGTPYKMLECQHVKPGKGNAFIRTRLKNLVNNSVLEKTFKSGETVEEPNLETKQMQFLYSDSSGWQFMDLESFEQIALQDDQVGDSKFYLTENLEIEILYFNDRPIALDIPNFVELKVQDTEPGVKGNTASGGGKPAVMETGLSVNVPFHIKIGDKLKIDTRDNKYIEKLK